MRTKQGQYCPSNPPDLPYSRLISVYIGALSDLCSKYALWVTSFVKAVFINCWIFLTDWTTCVTLFVELTLFLFGNTDSLC